MHHNNINFKVVCVGQSAVGKTSLIYKFVRGEFKTDYHVTLGVEFYTKLLQVDGDTIQLQIWDTVLFHSHRRGRRHIDPSSDPSTRGPRQSSWCLLSTTRSLLLSYNIGLKRWQTEFIPRRA